MLLQYRWALLILMLGAILLLVPEQKTVQQPTTAEAETEPEMTDLETKLERILSQVAGAGEVHVMLTVQQSAETVYQADTTQSVAGNLEAETVLTDQGSAEVPIAVKVISPVYQGALVVAEGGDRASVRLGLMEAVASVTGLTADQITVIKLKTD